MGQGGRKDERWPGVMTTQIHVGRVLGKRCRVYGPWSSVFDKRLVIMLLVDIRNSRATSHRVAGVESYPQVQD